MRIDGLGGDDIVIGGTGDDELVGGAGDDEIRGGGGTNWGSATFTPATIPGSQPVGWPSSAAWEELGIRHPGNVRFRYATVAGAPGEIPPATSNLSNDDFWFAAQAEGDLDDDGQSFVLEVYSESRIMYNSAAGAGGWE